MKKKNPYMLAEHQINPLLSTEPGGSSVPADVVRIWKHHEDIYHQQHKS